MGWTVSAQVSGKKLRPREYYLLNALSHGFHDTDTIVPRWIVDATCSIMISPLTGSAEILQNYGIDPATVRYSHDEPTNGLCWARYDHETKHLSLVLGLTSFGELKPTLDLSLLYPQLRIRIAAGGGFSKFENNTHSPQPTLDGFQTGDVMVLDQVPQIWIEQQPSE